MNAPRCELVIFDCDGVLVDSERLGHEVLVVMLKELGIPLSFDAAVARFMGQSEARGLEIIAELLGRPAPDGFLAESSERMRRAFAVSLRPVPGIVDVLERLSVPCCVASNGSHEKMRFTLGHTGLLLRFEGRLFSADDVARPKPAPDLFLLAARGSATPPQRCIVVEDSPTGVAAARAAGMRVFAYAGMTPPARLHDAGADVVFTAMHELIDMLDDAAHAG